MLILEFVILAFVMLIAGLTMYDFQHPFIPETAEELETWTCDNCGYHVEAMTIEGVVEGMRIHETSFDCESHDEEDV